jgi:hypothetical protein
MVEIVCRNTIIPTSDVFRNCAERNLTADLRSRIEAGLLANLDPRLSDYGVVGMTAMVALAVRTADEA